MQPLNTGLFGQVMRTLNCVTVPSIMCTQLDINLKIVCEVCDLSDEMLPAGALSLMVAKLRCSNVICECSP